MLMRLNKIVIFCGSLVLIVLQGVPFAPNVEGKDTESITCTGNVVDDQGRPVAGAKVRLYERNYRTIEQSFKTRFEGKTLTKADGQFIFNTVTKSDRYSDRRYLVVEKEGFALGWTNWDTRRDGAKELEIRLSQKAALSGTVVDESDKPISQAQVGVYWLATGEDDHQQHLLNDIVPELLTTRTDQAGQFTFNNIPPKARAEFLVRKTGYATVCTYTSSRDIKYTTDQSDIKLVLSKEATVQGVVVEKDSAQPVSGVTLTIKREGNRPITGQEPVSTADDGTFSIQALAAGKYVVQLVQKLDGLTEWVAEPAKVELDTGQALTDLRLQVCKGGILRIRVVNAQSNEPLGKAQAIIRDGRRNEWMYSQSNKKGIAQVRLMPGAYTFESIYLQGYNSKNPRQVFTIEDGTTKRFRQQLTPQLKYAGIVRDGKNQPVKGAKLIICPMGHQEVLSDAEGKFELRWDPGMGHDERRAPHLVCRHIVSNLAAVVILSEGKRTYDITLKPGVTVAGKVLDPNSRAITHARIRTMLRQTMWASTMSRESIRTDAEGNFKITALPIEQRYNIKISAKGYGDSHLDIHADDAVNNRLEIGQTILPVANLTVSGQLIDVNGHPIPDTRIESHNFEGGQPEHLTTRTDAQGKFTFDGVCEGKFNIRANVDQDGKRLSASAITNGGASGIKVIAREGRSIVQNLRTKTYEQVLQDGEKVIAGVALDENGLPVAGIPVGVCCHKKKREDGKFSWVFSYDEELTTTTDKQGRFAIELKEDGEYNLLFSPDHHASLIVYEVPVGQKDLKVTLPEGGTLTGRLVRMEKGRKVAIPNVEVKIDQSNRSAFTSLRFDSGRTTVTDAEGRFRFEHLRTKIRPYESMRTKEWDYIARVWKISYGDTSENIAFYEGTRIDDFELLVKPRKAQPLIGRALPGFEGITIDLSATQTRNKRILVCFFDMNQRPSRHYLAQLTGQAAKLKEKGIEIITIQASKVNKKKVNSWIKSNKIPFPVGMVRDDGAQTRSIWGVKSLPWLILADTNHVVIAEGFSLGELNDKVLPSTRRGFLVEPFKGFARPCQMAPCISEKIRPHTRQSVPKSV